MSSTVAAGCEVLKKCCQIPPGTHSPLVVFSMMCSASAGPTPDLQKTQKTARGLSSSGNHDKDTTMLNMLQVAGRKLLAEEFFSLFELLHRLQQASQVVDKHHGCWVLVPQLEAASSQVSKSNGITDFQNLRAAKKSGSPSTLLLAHHHKNSSLIHPVLHFVFLSLLLFFRRRLETHY